MRLSVRTLLLALTLACVPAHALCEKVLWQSLTTGNFHLPASSYNELAMNGSGLHIGVLVQTDSGKLVWARGHIIVNRHEQLLELIEKLHGEIADVIWAGEMEYDNRKERPGPGKLLAMNDTSGWWASMWKEEHPDAVNDVDRAYQIITAALPALAAPGKPRLYTRERDSDLAKFPHLDDYMNMHSSNFRHDLVGNLIRPMWILEDLRLHKKADSDLIRLSEDVLQSLDALEIAMQMMQLHHHGIPEETKVQIDKTKALLYDIRLLTEDGHVEAVRLKLLLGQGESLQQVVQLIRGAAPTSADVLVIGP